MSSAWEGYAAEQEGKVEEPLVDNAKAVLSGLINDLWAAEKKVEELEENLKEAKAEVRKIGEQKIPKVFEDMEIDDESVVRVNGVGVTIKTNVTATPKKENRDGVYDWLEEHGHGGIVKRKALFDLGRMKPEEAAEFLQGVENATSRSGKFERKVEPATLKSFVNKGLAEGVEIPMEMFGVYVKRVADIKS